jgi:hypothetical protein
MENTMPFKVFISYSEDDKKKMITLRKKLKRNSSFEPIIVADRRMTYTLLSDKVARAIEETDVLVPILTRKALFNQWVNQEIGYAKAKKKLIWPIVEDNIIDKLKGFVHKQYDLPYHFPRSAGSGKEAIAFRKCCSHLLSDLRLYLQFRQQGNNVPPLLIGEWNHEYYDRTSGNMIPERARIDKTGNYFIGNSDEPTFILRNINPEPDLRIISFDKVVAGTNETHSRERLRVENDGMTLTGSVKNRSRERRVYNKT